MEKFSCNVREVEISWDCMSRNDASWELELELDWTLCAINFAPLLTQSTKVKMSIFVPRYLLILFHLSKYFYLHFRIT